IRAEERGIGTYWLYSDPGSTLLFTENETDNQRLFNAPNPSPYVKDAFHRYVIKGGKDAVNPALRGTKAAVVYKLSIPAGGEKTINLRLQRAKDALAPAAALGREFQETFAGRKQEADEFYSTVIPESADADTKSI